jgi:hypothetical protein
MARRIKEFVGVSDFTSLDELIEQLVAIRDRLPADADAELRLKGDDVFGRQLSISYFREQTAEEAELDARYDGGPDEAMQRELARLQEKLGVVCFAAPGPDDDLRRAA